MDNGINEFGESSKDLDLVENTFQEEYEMQDSESTEEISSGSRIEEFFSKFRFKRFYFFGFLAFLCLILNNFIIENDTYWLVNTGKYILEHGFPTIEPFTIYSGLDFSIQQWLSAVIFYFLFENGQDVTLALFDFIIYLSICIVVYKNCMNLSSKNRLVSYFITIFTCLFLSLYICPRPQIISFLIFSLEIYFMELYIKNGKKHNLLLIVILSLILVNVHSALWPFFLIVFIPYFIDSFRFKFLIVKSQGYNKLFLTITFVLSFLVGFLNPYGLKNMLYSFYCYGNPVLNSYVMEMYSPNFKGISGALYFALFLIIVFTYVLFRGNTRIRYVLISLGTLYMGLTSIRNIGLFIVCATPLIAYYLKDIDWPERFTYNKKFLFVSVALLLSSSIVVISILGYNPARINMFRPAGAVNYISKELDYKHNSKNIKLFNGYNVGGYLEYCGIRTAMDSRAEVFLKSINKKEDIIIEHINFLDGTIYYKDYIKKYAFTHLLLYRGERLSLLLSKDKDYKAIYEDQIYVLFEVVKK